MSDLRRTVDHDRIREILSTFLENHNFDAPSTWAARMGIGTHTLLKFLHGAAKARRKTLLKIYDYIERYEKRERESNQVRIEVGLDDELSMSITPGLEQEDA